MSQQIEEVINEYDKFFFAPGFYLSNNEITLFDIKYLHIFTRRIKIQTEIIKMSIEKLMLITVSAVLHLGEIDPVGGEFVGYIIWEQSTEQRIPGIRGCCR